MGLFSRIRETNKMATRKSRLIPPSSSTERHHPHATDRRPMNIPPVRSKHLDRPVYDESSPPHPPGPSTSFPSLAQNAIHVLPRVAKDLYREAFYHITPYIGTEYPCTTEDLNASGGIARQIPLGGNVQAKKALWFTGPNAGPFIDPAKASREIFDHNQPKRMPSAAEERAIQRLVTGLKNAGQKYWGPDLAVKAFCDLDKVFFRGRLRGHVCLTWRSDESFQHYCFGDTTLLKGGKCVIQLNAYAIFCGFEVVSGFTQMFATLLHEMCHAYKGVRARCSDRRALTAHDKDFGTMLHAVSRRASELLGLERDNSPWPRHSYACDDDRRRVSKHSGAAPQQLYLHRPPFHPSQPSSHKDHP